MHCLTVYGGRNLSTVEEVEYLFYWWCKCSSKLILTQWAGTIETSINCYFIDSIVLIEHLLKHKMQVLKKQLKQRQDDIRLKDACYYLSTFSQNCEIPHALREPE